MNKNSYVILTALHCQWQYQVMSSLLIPNKLTEVEMPVIKEWDLQCWESIPAFPRIFFFNTATYWYLTYYHTTYLKLHFIPFTLSKRRHIHLTIYDALKNQKALSAPCEN